MYTTEDPAPDPVELGWIGTGRMGHAMVSRLLRAGHRVRVWNRTRAKAETLVPFGAELVDTPGALATCDVVFTMVGDGGDLESVLFGPGGLAAGVGVVAVLVDFSTVDIPTGQRVRERLERRGTAVLATPVSGNNEAARAGRLTIGASGPKDAFVRVEPLLLAIGQHATYLGGEEVGRLMKIAHNLLLGVITQGLAEVTVLAEKGGVARRDFLEFINNSVLGSTFTRYKTPAFVNLDMTPTFTTVLLRKDFDAGLAAARNVEAPMPVASLVAQLIGATVAEGLVDEDFAALLRLQARSAGLRLLSEDADVSSGLEERNPA